MKVAIVTGASRGIGAATAKMLAKAGYAVAVNYAKNEAAASDVVNKIKAFGGVAESFKADISKPCEVKKMFEDIKATLGEVDVLVNNAGISYIGLLQDMSDDEILSLAQVNLLGAIYCAKEAIKPMIAKKEGVIINISSMWGEVGASCEVVYSACKAGLIGFTKALAKEVGPSGIRVNCVSPGVINTDMNRELDDDAIDALCQETPLLRIGTPEDVARTVTFLASDEANFVTGQIFSVNGGII